MARREADYYPTPTWCVHRLLERVPSLLDDRRVYLEPCVGDGAILRGFNERERWLTNDIRETAIDVGVQHVMGTTHLDAATWLRGNEIGAWYCVTNPPFSIAQVILEAAVEVCEVVAFLLPIGFPCAEERSDWWRHHRPNQYAIPNRISFDGAGSPNAGHAWFVWGIDQEPIDILANTPCHIRKAAEAEARIMLSELALPPEPQQELFS